MLGEIATFVGIVKTVVEIWQQVKPPEEAGRAHAVATLLQNDPPDVSGPRQAVQTVAEIATSQMDPVSARSFMQDVEMRWVLDNLRQHLRSGRQWTIIEEPCFLLTAEKIDYMGNLETAHHTIGFTTGPLSAKEVDREFIRWAEWVKGRRGSQEALLIFLYHSLAGIDQAHILGLGARDGLFSQKQVSAGTLDLSRMRLETAKGWLDSYNAQFGAPSYWEAELQTFLADLHQHYLQIRGYFQ